MATVSTRALVDQVIANNGVYPGDEGLPPIVRIVEYKNIFDGSVAWGLIYEGEPLDRYATAFQRDPMVIWERPS